MPQNSEWLQKICFYRERLKFWDVLLYFFFALLHFNSFWSNLLLTGYSPQWSNGSVQGLHCCSQETDEYLEAFYLPICAQALSSVCFTHCKPLSARNEWQAYNLDCILMLLPYAAKRSGDSWGTARRSGGKGDIEFYAPVSAVSSPAQTQDGASWVSSTWSRVVQKRRQLCENIFNNNLSKWWKRK